MPADILEVILQLRNVSQFVSGSEEASKAVGGVGKSAEDSGKAAGRGWKGMVKWAAGATAIYGGVRYLRSAVNATNDLAKGTYALQKQTGMDTETSSEWVAAAKERGISAKQLQMGMVTLSKQMEKSRTGTATEAKTVADLRKQIDQVAAAGGKDAPKQLDKLSKAIDRAQLTGAKARSVMASLGVPLEDLQKGNAQDTILRIADAFQRMDNPTERAALAQKLFGRSGVALLPVLSQGRKGVEELLAAQKASGNYLSKDGLKAARDNVIQQRELEQAMAGLKVQLSLALMPALLGVGKVLLSLTKFLRPLTSNSKALQIVLAATAVTLVTLKVATMAYSLAADAVKVATALWTGAQWLLNAALDANPIGLVVIAVVGLIAVLVLAYKHIDQVRAAAKWLWKEIVAGAQYAWSWIKANWPLLLGILGGPFTLAAALIYQHFDAIKKYLLAFVAAVKKAFDDLVNYVKNIPGRIGGLLKKIPGGAAALRAATSGKNLVGSALGSVGLQGGGVVTRAGRFLVGERGPELVALPSGAAVTPLTGPEAIGGAGGLTGEVVIPLIVDGRELGRAVARVTADRLARR